MGFINVSWDDNVTPQLRKKKTDFPRKAQRLFISPSLEIIEEETEDFVPRSHDPPPYTEWNKIDGYGQPGGKTASGTLQAGFFENTARLGMKEALAHFGYVAFDTFKGEMYADDQYENEEYVHPARYPGHKPTHHWLIPGIYHSRAKIERKLAKNYNMFIKFKK